MTVFFELQIMYDLVTDCVWLLANYVWPSVWTDHQESIH